ncbi:hypothetical protein INS49_010470 [Diaporthe citri]|uniref:uncharacterized protein n=1 Tax=Diaporthe citri TaxID=83186 RepID=UPI001C7F27FD|nr:uncharacterized protein INS49_010470 [Diaporthe citri]KAG6362240.1 hypothetical protein INS49_010470 [Diaporthe citri]
MTTLPTPSLVEQANAILQAATQLQQQLDDHGLQQPSLEVGGRKDWHDAAGIPEILKTRSLLMNASQAMLSLAYGPVDAMSALTGPEVCKLEVMRTLDALGVPQAVPLRADIRVEELAATLGVNESLLYRHLQFAFLLGMFYEPREGFVAHTNLSTALVDFSPYIKMRLSPLFIKGVDKVPEALKLSRTESGIVPCELADSRHRNMWQMLEEDYPEGQGMKLFSAAMETTLLYSMGPTLSPYVHGFEWGSFGTGTVIDVGGGSGLVEVNLVKKFPDLDFVIQDLPTNAEPAQTLIAQHEAQDRIRFQAHDFFQPQPPQRTLPKAYLLSRVLHDWQDDDCIKILRNLLPAMETHGTKLLVCERMLPDRAGEIFNHIEQLLRTRDMIMFTLYGGGERRLRDWVELFRKADARLTVESVKQPLNSVASFLTLGIRTDQ